MIMSHYKMSPPQNSRFDARKGLAFTVWSNSRIRLLLSSTRELQNTMPIKAYQMGQYPPPPHHTYKHEKNTQIELTTVNKKTHTLWMAPPPTDAYKSSSNGAYPEAGCQDTYVNKEGDYVIYQLSGSYMI